MTEKYIPVSELRKIIDRARYAEDIESDLVELVNRYPEETPIGPTEADNWEYNGERWVKKEK